MSSYEENRSPEEIEREIEMTRSQMADTLDGIQRKLSPGQMVDEALGYLDEKSGRIGSDVLETLRENPVPATLAGVGLAWLAAAGWSRSTEPRPARYSTAGGQVSGGPGYGTGSRSPAGAAGQGGYGSLGSSLSEPAMGERAYSERRLGGERRSNGGGGLAGGTWSGPGREADRRRGMGAGSGLDQRIGETVGETRQNLGETVDTVAREVSETAGQVRQRAGRKLEQAREKAHELTGQAREKTRELADEARERTRRAGQRMRERTRHVIEDQPLILGALGIAVGAAIGASLPRTREEDRLLGPARDELLHRADETGGGLVREAREQVKSGMESMTSALSPGQPGGETERGESPAAAGPSSGTPQAGMPRQPGEPGAPTEAGGTGILQPGTGERIPVPPGGGESRRP